jgi:hypothetical protein
VLYIQSSIEVNRDMKLYKQKKGNDAFRSK